MRRGIANRFARVAVSMDFVRLPESALAIKGKLFYCSGKEGNDLVSDKQYDLDILPRIFFYIIFNHLSIERIF